MKFAVDANLLASAIRSNSRLVQAETLSVEIRPDDPNFVHVYGVGPSNVSRFSVPIKIETRTKNLRFAIPPETLLNVVSKRKTVSIEIEDSVITVTSSRYKASLVTTQTDPQVVVPKDIRKGGDGKRVVLSAKFVNTMAEMLPRLDLKPLLSTYDSLPIGVKATSKGTFVAAFDNYQSAFFMDKTLTDGDFEIQLPTNLFLNLSKEVKDKYKMCMTENAVYAWNDTFELSAVLATADDQIQLSQMIDLYHTLKSSDKGHKLVFQTQGIRDLIDNSRAVYEKDSVFEFNADSKKIRLDLRSSLGNMSTLIKLETGPKTPVQFTCDFGFFSQLLAKAPETLTMHVNESMLMFSNGKITYLLSLI